MSNCFAPRDANNSLPLPCRTTNGSPDFLRRISMSCQPSCAPMPVPNAFEMASLAANRAARNGAGFLCDRQYAISSDSKIRFTNRAPNFSNDALIRVTSMMSMPTPRIICDLRFTIYDCRASKLTGQKSNKIYAQTQISENHPSNSCLCLSAVFVLLRDGKFDSLAASSNTGNEQGCGPLTANLRYPPVGRRPGVAMHNGHRMFCHNSRPIVGAEIRKALRHGVDLGYGCH